MMEVRAWNWKKQPGQRLYGREDMPKLIASFDVEVGPFIFRGICGVECNHGSKSIIPAGQFHRCGEEDHDPFYVITDDSILEAIADLATHLSQEDAPKSASKPITLDVNSLHISIDQITPTEFEDGGCDLDFRVICGPFIIPMMTLSDAYDELKILSPNDTYSTYGPCCGNPYGITDREILDRITMLASAAYRKHQQGIDITTLVPSKGTSSIN